MRLLPSIKEKITRRKEAIAVFGAITGILISLHIMIASSRNLEMGSIIKNVGYSIFSFIIKHIFKYQSI